MDDTGWRLCLVFLSLLPRTMYYVDVQDEMLDVRYVIGQGA